VRVVVVIFQRNPPPAPDSLAFSVARLKRFLEMVRVHKHTRKALLAQWALRSTLLDLADLPGGDDSAYGVLMAQSHVEEVRELIAQWERRPHRAD
jgi:hypothetical protein